MSYNNCYQMQYKTYEMEPFSNISRVQYISSPNIFDNHMSLPFQSDFTKQQLKNYNQIDLSTSLSSSDKYLSNDDIVRNKNCNCDCHKKIICQCDCNNLLNQVNDLKNTNLQLTSDYIRNKNKNHYADNYIKQLEKEKEMFKNNFNNDVDKLKLDNGKLIDMLDKTFTNILLPLSKNINIPEGKLKGGVDYYSKRKLEFDNMINEQKDFLDNILKNNPFIDNMKNKSLDNSLNKNPYLNSSNLDDMKNQNKLYPNNYNIMRPYQTYEIDKNNQIDNNKTPLNEYKSNIYSPKTNIEYPNNNLNNSNNIPYDQFNNSIRNNKPNEFSNSIRSNNQDPLYNSYQSGKDYKPDNLSGTLRSQNEKINPNDKVRNKGSKKKLSPGKKPQNKKEKQLKGNQDKFIPNYPIGKDNQIPKDNKTNLNQSNELKKTPKSMIKKPSKNVKNLPLYDNKNQIKDNNLNDNILPNNQQLNNKINPLTGKPYLDDNPYQSSNLSGRDKESPMLSSLTSPFNQTFNSNDKENQDPSKDYMKYPSNYLDNKNPQNQLNQPFTNQIPNQINNINDPLNPNKTILNRPGQYPQNENNTNIPLNNNYLNDPNQYPQNQYPQNQYPQNQYPQNQYNSNIPNTNDLPYNNIQPNETRKNPKFLSSSIPYIQNYLKDNIINNNNLNTPYNEIPERKNHSSSPTQKETNRKLSPSNPYNKLKSKRTGSGSREREYNKIQYYPDGTCWACDVGCSVSTTGYSPMTFSPYVNTVKRRDVTPIKSGIRYEQYTRHKKKKH